MQGARSIVQLRLFLLFAFLLIFALTSASATVRDLSLRAARGHLAPATAIFWLLMDGAIALLGLGPAVLGYLHERRHGLMRQSFAGWGRDLVRQILLHIAAGLLAAEALVNSAAYSPRYWWIWTALAVSALRLLQSYVYPTWIMPLFARLVPLRDPALELSVRDLFLRAGLVPCPVLEWQVSGKTAKANAWFAGLGPARRILLTDTLLALCSPQEVCALVAHEIGHYAHRDTAKRHALLVLLHLVIFAAIAFWLRGMEYDPADLARLPSILIAWLFLQTYSQLLLVRILRAQELAADRFAWQLIPDVAPFIAALKRITEHNMVVFDRSEQWRFSHPATEERIRAAEQWAAQHPARTAAPFAP